VRRNVMAFPRFPSRPNCFLRFPIAIDRQPLSPWDWESQGAAPSVPSVPLVLTIVAALHRPNFFAFAVRSVPDDPQARFVCSSHPGRGALRRGPVARGNGVPSASPVFIGQAPVRGTALRL